MKRIYRTYADTEVVEIAVNVECPHCGDEWLEHDKTDCGVTYKITCEECEQEFEMHFDAS